MKHFHYVVLILVVIILSPAVHTIWIAAHKYSLIEPKKPPCNGAFGHARPLSFCDRRDNANHG